ncbi:dihydrofolate reductase [Mycoplasma hafezii]|uniref:dihydrofolate reductase n=1 Tax=Mycoplasma hafezii TaxID=525886 RepID=UPI003CF0CABE
MLIGIIAFIDDNGHKLIGYKDKLAWKCPNEIQHLYKLINEAIKQNNFRTIIVGSNTYNSLPKKFVEQYKKWLHPIYDLDSYQKSLCLIEDRKTDNILFGGKTIYETFLDKVDVWYISKISPTFKLQEVEPKDLVYLDALNDFYLQQFQLTKKIDYTDFEFQKWERIK